MRTLFVADTLRGSNFRTWHASPIDPIIKPDLNFNGCNRKPRLFLLFVRLLCGDRKFSVAADSDEMRDSNTNPNCRPRFVIRMVANELCRSILRQTIDMIQICDIRDFCLFYSANMYDEHHYNASQQEPFDGLLLYR